MLSWQHITPQSPNSGWPSIHPTCAGDSIPVENYMFHGRYISRRTLLKNMAATAGAFTIPQLLPGSALGLDGAVAPSNRITYGYIGCGNHGAGWNFDQVFRYRDAQIIAVCDVDTDHLSAAKAKVDGHYGQQLGKDYKGCAPTVISVS